MLNYLAFKGLTPLKHIPASIIGSESIMILPDPFLTHWNLLNMAVESFLELPNKQ